MFAYKCSRQKDGMDLSFSGVISALRLSLKLSEKQEIGKFAIIIMKFQLAFIVVIRLRKCSQ